MTSYKYYWGTSGADNLVGQNLPDTYNVFFPGGGNDTVTGAATRDFVYAEEGNDWVTALGGGRWNIWIWGKRYFRGRSRE